MFSPQRDMRELILEILKRESMSISSVARELQTRGVKLHRLELTGYLKALADMGVLKSRDIKPAKVFSLSGSRERNLYELTGAVCGDYSKTEEEKATLTAYTLQHLFRRAVFVSELKRCGVDVLPEGRRATPEERAEAKAIMGKLGYKVPNSDMPVIVEKELETQYLQVLSDIIVEALNARGYVGGTKQTRL